MPPSMAACTIRMASLTVFDRSQVIASQPECGHQIRVPAERT